MIRPALSYLRRGLAPTAILTLALVMLLVRPAAASEPDAAAAARLARQAAEYRADVPKTVLELQPFRDSESGQAVRKDGQQGQATLVDLNPRIGAWFVLSLDWGGGGKPTAYHLENPRPTEQTLHLAPDGRGLMITGRGHDVTCDVWSDLESAKRAVQAYVPLCGDRIYLRNAVRGAETRIERVTDVLRDHVWGGEAIVGFVKDKFYQDKFRETGDAHAGTGSAAAEPDSPERPRAAAMAVSTERPDIPQRLGIVADRSPGAMNPGHWYPARGVPGVFVSYAEAGDLAPEVLKSHAGRVSALDRVESDALVYLVAFDLARFDLGYALGTDHPRVGWSPRASPAVRNAALPGPDGIGTIAPLVPNGMLSPALKARAVATFTGGFKRQHGAFKYGPFAERNRGSHYGFIEQGAVLSKLQPGLATVLVMDDGTVDMKTWTSQDEALLPRIRHARQNGVPIIDYDPATKTSAPGHLVARWGPGNWSGSADEKLRSVRAGTCLQETAAKRFLVYAYFSDATPSAMARVFQGYGCKYAMLLDMNALEHTYLAVYLHDGPQLVIEHLVDGMAGVDKKAGKGVLARFIDVPDDRDFFYLVRREEER